MKPSRLVLSFQQTKDLVGLAFSTETAQETIGGDAGDELPDRLRRAVGVSCCKRRQNAAGCNGGRPEDPDQRVSGQESMNQKILKARHLGGKVDGFQQLSTWFQTRLCSAK